MLYLRHQDGSEAPDDGVRRDNVEVETSRSRSTTTSSRSRSSSTVGTSILSTRSVSTSSDISQPSRMQRAIFGARGQRPPCSDPGCFAAVAGGCGGCLVWSLGCHVVFLCVVVGAMTEQAVRHAHWRRRQRAYMSSSSEEDTDEDSPANGLNQDTIDRTTVVSTVNEGSVSKLLGTASSDGEHSQCMICVEPFAKGDVLRTLPCLHRYHQRCIDEWLKRSNACPICKHDVTETSVHGSTPVAPQPSGRVSSLRGRSRRFTRGFAQVARLPRVLRWNSNANAGSASSSTITPRSSVGRVNA